MIALCRMWWIMLLTLVPCKQNMQAMDIVEPYATLRSLFIPFLVQVGFSAAINQLNSPR